MSDTMGRVSADDWTRHRSVLVMPGFHAADSLDDPLETPEEAQSFERPVAPAGRDAVLAVIWAPVVAGVVPRVQDDAGALQDGHYSRRCGHVSPLVDLVGHGAQPAEREARQCHRLSRFTVQRNPEGG